MVDSYLSYFGVRVTDVDRSVRFYTEVFGLKEISRSDGSNSEGGIAVLLVDPFSGQRLELNFYPPGSVYAVPYVPGEGLDHVAFRVADLDAKLATLAKLGYRPIRSGDPVQLAPDFRLAYVPDPDGNWLEIWQYSTAMPDKPPETY